MAAPGEANVLLADGQEICWYLSRLTHLHRHGFGSGLASSEAHNVIPTHVECPSGAGVGTCVWWQGRRKNKQLKSEAIKRRLENRFWKKLNWMHTKIIKTKQAGSYWGMSGEFAVDLQRFLPPHSSLLTIMKSSPQNKT